MVSNLDRIREGLEEQKRAFETLKAEETQILKSADNNQNYLFLVNAVVKSSAGFTSEQTPILKYFTFLKNPSNISYSFKTLLTVESEGFPTLKYIEFPMILPLFPGDEIKATIFPSEERLLKFLAENNSGLGGNLSPVGSCNYEFDVPIVYQAREIQEREKALEIAVRGTKFSTIPEGFDLSSIGNVSSRHFSGESETRKFCRNWLEIEAFKEIRQRQKINP